jgi:hypothetical protein
MRRYIANFGSQVESTLPVLRSTGSIEWVGVNHKPVLRSTGNIEWVGVNHKIWTLVLT